MPNLDTICTTIVNPDNAGSTSTASIKQKKNRNHPRCAHQLCKIRLSMVDLDIECKCGLTFCGRHRLPEDHNCSYDHKGEAQAITAKMLNASACPTEKVIQV